jgi:hypothetical protein
MRKEPCVAKPSSFKHPTYLSEQELCDQLEAGNLPVDQNELVGLELAQREYQIGRCRPDFVAFGKDFISIIEVKITANMDSVRQIVFYKRIIDEYNRLYFIRNNATVVDVQLVLVARNFDSEILDICHELQIEMYKIEVSKDRKISEIRALNYDYFPTVSDDPDFLNTFLERFGTRNV